MATYLPKKLATSIGCELTFIPSMFQDIHAATGIEAWADYNEQNIRSFYAGIMEKALHKRGISFYKCTTDPYVVEVCTNKTNSAAEFRRVTKEFHKLANSIGMFSTTNYTKGGGAHIHSGMVNLPGYLPLMANFSAANPWLCFAFANPRDTDNAQAPTKDIFTRSTYKPREVSRNDLINNIIQNVQYETDYRAALVRNTEEQFHHRKYTVSKPNRGFAWRQEYWGDDISYYSRRMNEMRLRVAKGLKELAKYDMDRYTKVEVTPEVTLRDINTIHFPDTKSYAMSYRSRYDTIEFRAFLMPETWHGHVKQVALVDAIVRKVIKQCEQGVTHVDDTLWYTREELKGMKYSAMVKGFNAMLTDLDLNPADFREERVNMAIRKRFMRTAKCSGAY